MKKVLLALLLSAVPALADADGADILPFTSTNGVCSGVVAVYPDGTATCFGQYNGILFTVLGKWARDGDGNFCFNPLLSDGDTMKKKGGRYPFQLKFRGTHDDANDGDDTDDDVGELTIGSGCGYGSIRLTG